MSLDPLATASFAIQFHVACAVTAFVLGAIVLFRKKGGPVHRVLGRVWVVLMVGVSLSSFFISEDPVLGPFGPIHALSVLTLAGLARGVYEAVRRNIPSHRATMQGVYGGALILAGAFTFLPGRRLHDVLFGEEGGFAPSLVIIAIAFIAVGLLFRRLRQQRRAPLVA